MMNRAIAPRRYLARVAVATLGILVLASASASATGIVASPMLPDGRAYELVSTLKATEVYPPVEGQNQSDNSTAGEYYGPNDGAYRVAENGDAVAYAGDPPTSGVGGTGNKGNGLGNQYLSKRSSLGWQASDIEPAVSGSGVQVLQGFSSDLSVALLFGGDPQFTPSHGGPSNCGEHQTLFEYTAGAYSALIKATSTSENCYATGAAISADDSHVLFQAPFAYTPEAALPAEFGEKDLYDSVKGLLHLVNVLPNGEPESQPDATFGSPVETGTTGNGVYDFDHVVSTDGSRVFWTRLEGNSANATHFGEFRLRALYVRENDAQPQSKVVGEHCTEPARACTIEVDAAEAGAEGPGGGGRFWTANDDGSKVFFTDCNRLTVNSTAVTSSGCTQVGEPSYEPVGGKPAGNDLYEYDVDSGRVSDLSVDPNSTDALGADVQGVVGIGGGGSYVYFAANGVLTAGPNAEGREPVAGQPNLYVSHGGVTSFIATLVPEDDAFPGAAPTGVTYAEERAGDWRAEPGARTAKASRDGHVLGFMSRLPLTGYDNTGCHAPSGRCSEVFVYDLDTERISCASCDPGGVPPVEGGEEWQNVRGAYVSVSGSQEFMSRWIDQDGNQVYFDTSQPLAPQDTNHYQDVYEWQREGSAEGCSRETPARADGGCLSLLSGGDAPSNAYFVDAGASGRDVFLTTRELLTPQATDENVKVYDARACTSSSPCFHETATACAGTGCQGVPPAPPIFATPSSVTFNGVGNFEAPVGGAVTPKRKSASEIRAERLSKALRACRKKTFRRRIACGKQARKRYAPVRKKGKR